MISNFTIFGTISALMGAAVLVSTTDLRLPADNQGYEPEQPIAFSHRVHAGELAMDCQFCHFGARNSRHAGVPPASVCMNCHQVVTSGFEAFLQERMDSEIEVREPLPVISPELQKLYNALGLDEERRPDPLATPTPIEWVRIHQLPDFVYFDHRPHVARGMACEICHGPVQSMERMRQFAPLSMGWCIDCHRSNDVQGQGDISADGDRRRDHVTTDCVNCHI